MSHTKHREPTMEDIDAALNALDPATTPPGDIFDGEHWRRIIAARKATNDADGALRRTVTEARAAGYSWTIIGAALGITRQGAYQRFGRH